MIRKLFHSGRSVSVHRGDLRQQNKNQFEFGQFEKLEDKLCLAFGGIFDGGTSTLTLNQTADDGIITIDNNGGGDAFRATDGSGTVTFVAANNVIVNLLDGTGNNFDLDLDNAHAGNVTLNLGDGARDIEFTGSNNVIGGDLSVNSGTGNQNVDIANSTGISVFGQADFDMGTGDDVVNESSGSVTISGDLNFNGVNSFMFSNVVTVGGNFSMVTTGEIENSDFADFSGGGSSVAGNFTYSGGTEVDDVFLGDLDIGGNLNVSLGSGFTGSLDDQDVEILTLGSVAGTTMITSGTSTNGDWILVAAGATLGGDITMDLGNGANTVDLLGTFNGNNVSYTGGLAADDVEYDLTGNPADVNITLGSGNDIFTLGATASIDPTTLNVNFGDDDDTFNNDFGAFTFNAVLTGLQGFDYSYDAATQTLTAVEGSNTLAVEFDNNGPSNAIRFNNGAVDLTPANNLSVTMLDGSTNQLRIDLDVPLAGNLTVNSGDGARTVEFNGTVNTINGDLVVTGGALGQTVNISVNDSLMVGGNARFDLGTGFDTVDENTNDLVFLGNLRFEGVNRFENDGTMTVAGNVVVDASGETESTQFDDDNNMAIGGNLTYRGGDGRDQILLNGAGVTSVGGNLHVDLGDNTLGGTQRAYLNAVSTMVGGQVTVLSSNENGVDDYRSDATVNGDVYVRLGDGPNDADFGGTFGGSHVQYVGGLDVDTVTFSQMGTPADVNIVLGAGDDIFTLEAGASISPTTLRVDFGGGNDDFTNNFGPFAFNANLLNWDGFSRYYTLATDTLILSQVDDLGDVTIDDAGAGTAIRLLNGSISEMTPADNIEIYLMANSSTNLNIDFTTPIAGDLWLGLNSGDRDVMFTGFSNVFAGLVRIESGDGDQNIHLAVNNDFNSASDLIINGRAGNDSIDDGANNLTVGNNMILRGVNGFENTNTLNVLGNFNMVSNSELQATTLDNDGAFNIGGNLFYLGGDAADDVLLNVGSAVVVGDVYIDLGGGDDLLNAQNVSLTGGFMANSLRILGGSSQGGNTVQTDANLDVIGDVIVNFSTSTTTNTVLFFGTYDGSYGTYRGGSGVDNISFASLANDMTFATRLGEGNDTYTLEGTASLLSLLLDFGPGNDTFVDNLGQPYPFPVSILNLP